MSSTHITIANESGLVYVAGPNANGQLSLGTTTQTNTATFARLDASTNITSILHATDGSAHSLFLRSIGLVYAAGANTNGQLGLGTTVDISFAALVQQTSGIDLSNVIAIAAGGAHSIFLLSSGLALACGLNTSGQLGDGTTTQFTFPTLMNTALSTPITSGVSISAGNYHSLVSKSDGTVFSAGINANGQLGIGTLTNQSYLQQVKTGVSTNLSGISQVVCGGSHSLALTTSNTVYAWGANAAGQLAIGTTEDSQYATLCLSAAATTLANIVHIAAGSDHSLFLTSAGTVFACGSNTAGQLADGTLLNKSYPVQVLFAAGQPLTQIVAVHATANQSYFLSRDGIVYVAGFNGTGAFGNGTTTNSSYAIQGIAPNATGFKAMGYSASYARRRGATIANLQTAGYTTLEIVCAGYSSIELNASSITIPAMRTAGVSYKQLISAGYLDNILYTFGYSSPTIVPLTMDGSPLAINTPVLYAAELFTSSSLTVSGQTPTYRNGTYTISSSADTGKNYLAFNRSYAGGHGFWEVGSYNTITGIYIGNTFTTTNIRDSSNIAGQWLQIRLPYKLLVKTIGFLERQDGDIDRLPYGFVIVGSNNGTNWNIIYQQTGPSVPYLFRSVNTENVTTATAAYSYIRLIVRAGAINGEGIITIKQLNYEGDIYSL